MTKKGNLGLVRGLLAVIAVGCATIAGGVAQTACVNGQVSPVVPTVGGITLQDAGCVIEHYQDSDAQIIQECNLAASVATIVSDLATSVEKTSVAKVGCAAARTGHACAAGK